MKYIERKERKWRGERAEKACKLINNFLDNLTASKYIATIRYRTSQMLLTSWKYIEKLMKRRERLIGFPYFNFTLNLQRVLYTIMYANFSIYMKQNSPDVQTCLKYIGNFKEMKRRKTTRSLPTYNFKRCLAKKICDKVKGNDILLKHRNNFLVEQQTSLCRKKLCKFEP